MRNRRANPFLAGFRGSRALYAPRVCFATTNLCFERTAEDRTDACARLAVLEDVARVVRRGGVSLFGPEQNNNEDSPALRYGHRAAATFFAGDGVPRPVGTWHFPDVPPFPSAAAARRRACSPHCSGVRA